MCETLCQVQSNLIRATLRFSCSPFNETSRRASRARGIKLSTLYLVSEHFCLNQIHFFFLLAKTTTPMIPHYFISFVLVTRPQAAEIIFCVFKVCSVKVLAPMTDVLSYIAL